MKINHVGKNVKMTPLKIVNLKGHLAFAILNETIRVLFSIVSATMPALLAKLEINPGHYENSPWQIT